MTGLMIMMDPPEHERARTLVGRVFSPRAVQALEPMVAEVIDGILAPFDGADSFDAVADFSGPFPVEIICRMLGVPEGERQQIRHWLDLMLERRPGERDPTPEGMVAAMELVSYFLELVAEKRRRPADDMTSRLIRAEMVRPDGRHHPARRRRDRRLPQPPRGRRLRDRDQAGGQRRRALPPPPRPVRPR